LVLVGCPAVQIIEIDCNSARRTGRRANDINQRMRNATHALTDQEIDVLAKYYASM
jgi:cytochrome c553